MPLRTEAFQKKRKPTVRGLAVRVRGMTAFLHKFMQECIAILFFPFDALKFSDYGGLVHL